MNAQASALLLALPRGRDNALPGDVLAMRLGVHKRSIQVLVNELIDEGHPVGSRCDDRAGYFVMLDAEDFRVGTEHFRRRALTTLSRYRALQRMSAQFGTTPSLFSAEVL